MLVVMTFKLSQNFKIFPVSSSESAHFFPFLCDSFQSPFHAMNTHRSSSAEQRGHHDYHLLIKQSSVRVLQESKLIKL